MQLPYRLLLLIAAAVILFSQGPTQMATVQAARRRVAVRRPKPAEAPKQDKEKEKDKQPGLLTQMAADGANYCGRVASVWVADAHWLRQQIVRLEGDVLPLLEGRVAAWAAAARSLAQKPATEDVLVPKAEPESFWLDDYAEAMRRAEHENKMLFVYFCNACGDEACNRFQTETLEDAKVRAKLRDYVRVQVSPDAAITVDGKKVKLLEHPAFQEMLGRPGIAIVDFRSDDSKLRGTVVSTFPITDRLAYTPEQMAVILDLPPGTLTQRTLIYAVRIHPEKPASTTGQLSADLLNEAESHSQHQADIRLQGHHQWGSRFQRIISRLPGGGTAREVCAESWPGENLVEAAIECVRCWRLSDGHWSAVRAPNRFFGYDMKRGSNGVWYATGIFGIR